MRARHGFTLVELSVVLVVIALISGMGLAATMGMLESAKRAATESKLNEIEKALMAFRNRYNRLPCPGGITLTETSSVYGLEAATPGTCTGGSPAAIDISGNGGTPPPNGNPPVVQGGIPARTLGLPDEFMFDGWGRRFLYAIDANATVTNAFSIIPVSAERCGVTVKDAAGGYRSGSASGGGSVYTLVSHGSNGHGAYVNGSTRISSGSTNTDELDNCNCTATGANGTTNASFVQKEPTENSSTATDVFDDIVRFKERWQLQNTEDSLNARDGKRCQLAIGVATSASTSSDPVNCYKRGCDGWNNLSSATTYIGTTNSSNISNLFFSNDNSYLFANFALTTAGACGAISLGVCASTIDGPAPSSETTIYCSYSCGDNASSGVQFSLSDNNYLGIANRQNVPLQFYKVSSSSLDQLNIASSITPALVANYDMFILSSNAEYFLLSTRLGGDPPKIYKRYTPRMFKEIHSSKYPPDLPAVSDIIFAAAFSPNGKFLAFADYDTNEVIIWEIGEGNVFGAGGTNPFGVARLETIALNPSDCYPYSLAFSPDGKYLAVGLGAADCGAGSNIADNLKIYKIDGTTFTPVTIASGAPNIFYNSGGNNIPDNLVFTADSNKLLIATFDTGSGVVTLDRINETTFEQRVPRITPGGGYVSMGSVYPNTAIAVLH